MKVKDLVEIASDETLFDICQSGEYNTMFFGNGLQVYQNRNLITKDGVLWELDAVGIKPYLDEVTAHMVLMIIVA